MERAEQAGVRIALDAMGGDHAPGAIVRGALIAQQQHGIDVLLVGVPDRVDAELRASGAAGALPVAPATDAIGMDEDPALALRAKPDASVRVGARLVAAGEARALVSAGSTGATLAAALLELGRIAGVRRPVVAAVLPVAARRVVLVDAGGSPDGQPDALTAAARMGAAYAQALGVTQPRVGLLNVGSEPGKGNALMKQAFALLDNTKGFVGNVEPAAVLGGDVDVVVTDGFTGNIFLKTVEAVAVHDDDAAGAAALLGVAGDVLIAHGAAREQEVVAALRTAVDVAASRLSIRIRELLGE